MIRSLALFHNAVHHFVAGDESGPGCGAKGRLVSVDDVQVGPGHRDAAHIRQIKDMLARPGVLSATLAYYRAMLDPAQGDPSLAEVRQRMQRPIRVPTLALCGSDDLREELMVGQAEHFAGEYQYRSVAGAGHFLHRKSPRK